MAFTAKIDYCGLVEATKVNNVATLLLRDDNPNGSVEKYQPQGQDGSFVLTHIFGGDSAPTNTYGLKADISMVAGAIKLGKLVSITTGSGQSAVTKKYSLENVKIATKIGAAPTISATCQEVEDDASDSTNAVYWIPAFTLSRKYEPQDIFGAFTSISGEGCHVQEFSMDLAAKVGKDDVAGVKISSDIDSGVITVTGNILSTAGNTPTLTVNPEAVSLGNSLTSNWVLTSPPADRTGSNPEKSSRTFDFEVQLPLKKYRPTPASNG